MVRKREGDKKTKDAVQIRMSFISSWSERQWTQFVSTIVSHIIKSSNETLYRFASSTASNNLGSMTYTQNRMLNSRSKRLLVILSISAWRLIGHIKDQVQQDLVLKDLPRYHYFGNFTQQRSVTAALNFLWLSQIDVTLYLCWLELDRTLGEAL